MRPAAGGWCTVPGSLSAICLCHRKAETPTDSEHLSHGGLSGTTAAAMAVTGPREPLQWEPCCGADTVHELGGVGPGRGLGCGCNSTGHREGSGRAGVAAGPLRLRTRLWLRTVIFPETLAFSPPTADRHRPRLSLVPGPGLGETGPVPSHWPSSPRTGVRGQGSGGGGGRPGIAICPPAWGRSFRVSTGSTLTHSLWSGNRWHSHVSAHSYVTALF